MPTDDVTGLPDPGEARNLDDLVRRLRSLKVWAGDPSYEVIVGRVTDEWTASGRPAAELPGRTTITDCFRAGRRRLNAELVVAIVSALHPDGGYAAQWRQALRVIGGEIQAAGQVRVQDRLPPDLAGFTGRTAELDRLRDAFRRSRSGAAVVTIAGMAGVGKTQLAVHLGHHLVREGAVDRVLFVNLRGLHPDPSQPPADPAAVLDGFLRLLGVPGQRVPHDLAGRTAAYRERLAGTRTLVLLDDAADAGQVQPLLPGAGAGPGGLVLVTSRRDLTGLDPATHLTVDAFTVDESRRYLALAAPDVPVGDDPGAAARIAVRCGHLPLALGLVIGHIHAKPGWTLTDHAGRLDEYHRHHRVDSGIQIALDLSYQQLPATEQRLLRLIALHPGHDIDAYAAAALADTGLGTAQAHLDRLHRDHLLQQAGPDRYTLHDLVRAYATSRATDDDPPPERRAALTRLFDFYLATAAMAMDSWYPAEAYRRPRVGPPRTAAPVLDGPDAALAWLDTERPALIAVALHTAGHGWPAHATRLSTTLFRYLDSRGHLGDALAVQTRALPLFERAGDPTGRAHALTNLGATCAQLGRYHDAADHLEQARRLFAQAGDPAGQARALGNLGIVQERMGRYREAADHHERALDLFRQAGDRAGEARALDSLGIAEERLGRYRDSAGRHRQALALYQAAGDRIGEAEALSNVGHVEIEANDFDAAAGHLEQALELYRQLGNRAGEASAGDSLGILCTRRGRPDRAMGHHQQALAVFRETGQRGPQAWALNGLGEAARAGGRPGDALTHHTAAYRIAADIGDRHQQARAHTGLGHAHRALGDPDAAGQHWRHALVLYTDLGLREAEEIRSLLEEPGLSRSEPAMTDAEG